MTRDDEILLALAKLAACNRELVEKTKELDKSIAQLTELTHGAVRTLNERVAALEARLDARDEAWARSLGKDTPPRLRGIPCPECDGCGNIGGYVGQTPCARCSGTGEIL